MFTHQSQTPGQAVGDWTGDVRDRLLVAAELLAAPGDGEGFLGLVIDELACIVRESRDVIGGEA